MFVPTGRVTLLSIISMWFVPMCKVNVCAKLLPCHCTLSYRVCTQAAVEGRPRTALEAMNATVPAVGSDGDKPSSQGLVYRS